MRRGATVHALHFSGAPQSTDASKHLVREILALLQPMGGLASYAAVDFGDYQRQIALAVPERLRVLMYRRLMFSVACAHASKLGAKALVTGESLGQVASQTLANIAATDEAATLPVLRPLIGNDKQEIVDEAKRIGSFAISSVAHDDCCTLFMPKKPETQAKLPEVLALWQSLPVANWLEAIAADMAVTTF
jgi:thiamine biosynthesis protein ThiI